jgi:uncharacterized protein
VGGIGLDMIAVSLLAGFVDAIAGGGGLLTVPALLVAVSALMALRLLLDPANPWRQGLKALF